MSTTQIPTTRLAGLDITTLSRADIAQLFLRDYRAQRTACGSLPAKLPFSVNGQGIALLWQDPEYRPLMNRATYLHADGQSIIFASQLLTDFPIAERSATTDLFHDIAAVCQRHGISCYFLGSTPEINTQALARIRTLYPRMRIVGAHHGYESDPAAYLPLLKAAKPDIVWLAMGKPRQEYLAEWLSQRIHGPTWIKPCGGLFEFLANPDPKTRAPLFMQRAGLEWLYRAAREPRRLLWRYLSTNMIALALLLTHAVAQKLSSSTNHHDQPA